MKRKASNKDFLISNLPYNRKEQFYDVMRHRYSVLIKCGLLLALFILPILICVFFKDLSTLNLINSGEEDKDVIASIVFTTDILYRLLIIPSLFILSIGLSGVLRIIRNLIFSEPIFFKEDFKDGIKANIKSLLVIFAIVGFVSLLGGVFSNIIGINYLSAVPQAFNYLVVFPMCFIAAFLTSIYKNTFFVNLRTSGAIYIKHLFKVLLTYGTLVVIVLAQFIPAYFFIIKLVLLLLLVIFYIPIALFISYLYQVNLYDKYINFDQFPEYYLKGLYKAKSINK